MKKKLTCQRFCFFIINFATLTLFHDENEFDNFDKF